MTGNELAERFGVSRRTINDWVQEGIIPRPTGRGPNARYTTVHVEAIQAWFAFRHHFVSGAEAIAFCRESGITLTEYLKQREASIRDFGIGVA